MPVDAGEVLAITVSRGDAIGYVFLAVTIVFAVLGYRLSQDGLKADAAAKNVKDAAEAVKSAALEAQQVTAQAQQSIVAETGDHAETVAASSTSVANATNALESQISGVNDALAGLTGNQAPARVMWALAALCLVAALVGFDLISVEVASSAGTGSGG